MNLKEKVTQKIMLCWEKMKKIDFTYYLITLIIISFFINIGVGIIFLFFSPIILFFLILFFEEKFFGRGFIVLAGFWFALLFLFPGKTIKTEIKNKQDVNLTISNGEFVVKYLKGNNYKLKFFKTIPKCNNYQIYFKVKIRKLLGKQFQRTYGPFLGCKK